MSVAGGVNRTHVGIIGAASAFDTSLSSVNTSWLSSIASAINNIDISKVSAITDVFRSSKNISDAIKEASKIAKAFNLAGRSGSRFSSVNEAYDFLTKKEVQKEAFNSRIRDFQPVSWMSRYRDAYGNDAQRIASLELDDELLSITNPKELHRKQVYRKWGYSNGDHILDAEHDEEVSRKKKDRRRSELLGSMKYRHDMMDEYDQKVYDLGHEYGGGRKGRARAENKIRSDVMKGLPKFMQKMLKNSTMSTRDLESLVSGMRKTPIFGKFIKNPSGMAIATAVAAYMATAKFLERSETANKDVVDWQNAVNLYGVPDKKFTEMAMLAGAKNPAEIAKLYGEATLRYGNANNLYRDAGNALKSAGSDPLARQLIAQQFGLNGVGVALADMMSGNRNLENSRARQVNKEKNKILIQKELGLSSGSGFWDTINSLWYSVPGVASARARNSVTANKNHTEWSKLVDDKFYGMLNDSVNSTVDAAKKDDVYEEQKSSTTNISNSNKKSVSITIGTVQLPNVRDGGQFPKELERTVVDTFDMGILA